MLRPAVQSGESRVATPRSMDPVPSPGEEAPDDAFARQAAATGLVVPARRPTDPWGAVAIAVALIVIAAGVGEVTGWINLRSAPAPAGFQYLTCSGTSIRLDGAIAADLDPSYATWLVGAGSSLSESVGGCFTVSVTNSSSSGAAGALSDPAVKFAAAYVGPAAPAVTPANVSLLPVALTAVGVVYDLPSVTGSLNLSGSVLAGIFSGSIRSWDDPEITALNPGLNLAGLPALTVLYDSASTGSNAVFTQFLAGSNSSWNESVGAGESVAWPTGMGIPSDAAMLGAVRSTPGAIGYVDLMGNDPAGLEVAQIEDDAGSFVAPGAVSTWIAAESFANSSALLHAQWSNVSLLGAAAPGSYPLSMLTYMGVYRDLGVAYGGSLSLSNATWMLEFVDWLASGSALAPLPPSYSAAAIGVLNNETYDGTPILPADSESGESGGETGEF
jgi:phosphate transport system substrate-binding protein